MLPPFSKAQGSKLPGVRSGRDKAKEHEAEVAAAVLLWLSAIRTRYLSRIGTLDPATLFDEIGVAAQSQAAMVAALAETGAETETLVATLSQAFQAAAQSAADEAMVNIEIDPVSIDIADEIAAAGDRAPELLGLQRVADRLMPAEPGVESTTANMVRQTIGSTVEPDLTVAQLVAALDSSFAFSADRAAGIAETEVLRASNVGALAVYVASGFVEGTAWETEGDDRVDGECELNEQIEFTPLGQLYPSGHAAPPAHPKCRCRLVPMTGPPANQG